MAQASQNFSGGLDCDEEWVVANKLKTATQNRKRSKFAFLGYLQKANN